MSFWPAVTVDPWTADDPQPGDFDAILADLDARDVEVHEGYAGAPVRLLVTVQREDARRLERLATTQGKSAHNVEMAGSYEAIGDVLYLSTPDDDKRGAAQETPEGHAIRLAADGRVTGATFVNARWIVEREGRLGATLRDGRRLVLRGAELAALWAAD